MSNSTGKLPEAAEKAIAGIIMQRDSISDLKGSAGRGST
jgi:hypothetical protein